MTARARLVPVAPVPRRPALSDVVLDSSRPTTAVAVSRFLVPSARASGQKEHLQQREPGGGAGENE